jgi:hypothetical protein
MMMSMCFDSFLVVCTKTRVFLSHFREKNLQNNNYKMDPAAILERELRAQERVNDGGGTGAPSSSGSIISRRNSHGGGFGGHVRDDDENDFERQRDFNSPPKGKRISAVDVGTNSKNKHYPRAARSGKYGRGRIARAVQIGFGVREPEDGEDGDVKFAFKIFFGLFLALLSMLARENANDSYRWLQLEKRAEKERFTSLRVEGAVKELEKNMNGFIETSLKEAKESAASGEAFRCPPKRKCPPKPTCEEEEEEERGGGESQRRRHLLSSGEDGDDESSSSSSSSSGSKRSKSSKAADDPFLDDLIPKRGIHDFKIFVYDLKPEYNVDLVKDQPRCRTDQYGTEIRFHENLLHHSVLTNDPEEAEFFFVPIYGECYLFRETQKSGTNNAMKVTNLWYRDALKTIQTEYPYWNRTDGRDHVWSFPGARGPHIFRDWKKLIKKSIFLTPEGDRSFGEQFNTWKDIVIPGLEPDSEFIDGKLRKQSSLKKDIFAFFRGTILNKAGILAYSRGIRPKMEAAFKKHKDVIFTEEISSCDRDCYRKELRKSTFCLCPRGWSPWTLRAYQAMMVGCIPVIIADEIELPYENSLDWTKLSVKIAEVDAEKTIDILKQIPKSEIKNKQKAIEKVWKSVAWGSNPKKLDPMDAMECVLHELGRKKRAMKASTQTFWFE